MPTFRAEKEICGLFGTDIFFVTRNYFFIENIRNMIKKNRYPGVDIKFYIAALHIKKKRDLERCTQLI